jgi:hypothetical protein
MRFISFICFKSFESLTYKRICFVEKKILSWRENKFINGESLGMVASPSSPIDHCGVIILMFLFITENEERNDMLREKEELLSLSQVCERKGKYEGMCAKLQDAGDAQRATKTK